jgi:DNA-binding PadR family transcriptional regulator
MPPVTELESCVLGIVWQGGPLTAYEVAKPFADSQSSYWSGSAGAIYPLVKRLEEKGFIKGKLTPWNGRKKRTFTITNQGLSQLRTWLSPPYTPDVGAASFDPIRTRLVFIEALPKAARAQFIDDAERVVSSQLKELQKLYRQERERERHFDAISTRGAIHELQARLRWLAEVRREVLA